MKREPRKLLVAKIGVASITYAVLASPIACNLPAPPPGPRDAQQDSSAPSPGSAAPGSAEPTPSH